MTHYEIWTAPYKGENALRHEYHRHGEDLDKVIAEARSLARTERDVCVVEISEEGDRHATVMCRIES
ncbi:MAG TPA: hypothetical protein PLJ11_05160 [Methanomassiliicoccales archaeon]|nr:hypothetical protein [Methanomassiliicoccales archaeon]